MRRINVSIIIPVYNSGPYLERTIKSINEKLNVEIIIVNDGSTDKGTLEVLCRLAKEYKVLNKENGGSASARNAGAVLAKGDYLLFLDSDDLLEKHFCTKMVALLEKNKEASYAYPGAVLFGNRVGYWPNREFNAKLLKYYTYFLVTSLMRKDFFQKMKGFNEKYRKLEDREFWVRSVRLGFTGIKADCLFFYRHHHESKTAGVNEAKQMFYIEKQIRNENKEMYSLGDFFDPVIVFHNTYLKLFYLIPTFLKNYLLDRNLKKSIAQNPSILRRFPKEVVDNFRNEGLI